MAETDDAAAAAAAAAEGGGGGASAAADAAEAAAAAEATDQWVQCDRCRTWRIVPDQHWPSVEADTREVSRPLALSPASVFCCPWPRLSTRRERTYSLL